MPTTPAPSPNKAGREARTDGLAVERRHRARRAWFWAGGPPGSTPRRTAVGGGANPAGATDAEAAPSEAPFDADFARRPDFPRRWRPCGSATRGSAWPRVRRGRPTRWRSVRRGAEIPLDGRHSSRRPEPGWATLSGKGRIPSVTALGVRDAWPAQDKGLGFHAGWRGSETAARPRGTTRRSPAPLRPRNRVPKDGLAGFAGSGPDDHAGDLGPAALDLVEGDHGRPGRVVRESGEDGVVAATVDLGEQVQAKRESLPGEAAGRQVPHHGLGLSAEAG